MAPLRSSRSTRNQDHQVSSRNRPGLVDLDPTEGLPVQKWEQVNVKVNQDPSSDPSATTSLPSGTTTTSSAEWAAQFNTPQFPWPEKPLPSFFSQLPPHNQEMIRRARAGNTNAKLSVWDRKTNSWISAAEAEKRQNPLKSVHLNNLDSNTGTKQNTAPDSPAHDDEEEQDDKSDDEIDVENADDDTGPSNVKRRKKFLPEERTFEVKKWVQMPLAVAEKTEERKFLADRRPGMPSLYGGAYQNQVFGSMGLNTNGYGFSAANAGYDLGDGGGLGNAGTMLQSNEGASTPVRKNMPPKRKKKKGGPGRKKANPDPVPSVDVSREQGAITDGQGSDGAMDARPLGGATMIDGDNEISDSGSEGEGSEEGEIDEGGQQNDKQSVGAENPADVPTIEEMKQEAPATANEQEVQTKTESASLDVPMSEVPPSISPKANTTNPEPELPVASLDIDMQEAPIMEQSSIAQPEAEVIPSIVPPSMSEQVSGSLPAKEAPTAPVEEATLQPTVPAMQEQMPNVSDIPQPSLELISDVQPQSLEPQQPDATPIEVPATVLPSLEPVPVQPGTLLPPISTAVTEAVNQPLMSAPETEPVIDKTATDHESASQHPPQPVIPEPTSPDLLGGLEDELNKNMDEHDNE